MNRKRRDNRIWTWLLALTMAVTLFAVPAENALFSVKTAIAGETDDTGEGGDKNGEDPGGGNGGELTPTPDPDVTPEDTPPVNPTPELTPEEPDLTETPKPTETPGDSPTPSESPTPIPTDSPTPTPTPEGQAAYANVASELNVRERYPKSTYEVPNAVKDSKGYAVQLTPGTPFRILEEKYIGKYSDGSECWWCKIRVDYRGQTGIVGYVARDYAAKYTDFVREDPEYLEYTEYLRKQGFPEAYWEPLRILHQQHPNWTFKAQKTGLSWSDVVAAEYSSDQSLVNKAFPTSWKSTDPGNYLWMNADGNDGGFTTYDGGNWNAASKEILMYCLDPRNFLGEKAVFMFEQQSFDPTLHTLEGVQSMLVGSHMEGTIKGENITYAEVLMEAAEISGVSPYFLAARIFQEVGRRPENTSSIINGSTGYYNYYNFGSNGSNPVSAGLSFARGNEQKFKINGEEVSDQRPWNTRRKAIIGGAVRLGADYVAKGQDSLYLQKFNVTSNSTYRHQYMTNVTAPYQEADLYYSNLNPKANPEVLDTPFVFSIPVYNGMPEKACQRPIDNGNPNGYLKELSVVDQDITPDFDYKTLSYDLVVGPGTASVTITAKAIADTTKVSGAGKVNLKYGENAIKIECKAGNGKVITYTINVFRKETTESIVSSLYNLTEEQIVGVPLDTKVETFLSGITVTGSSKVQVLNAAGEPVTSGIVGTGWCLKTDDFCIPVIIYGDSNGDGAINATDLLYLRRHILGISSLKGPAAKAADVKKDGEINASDLLYMRRHIMGIALIKQP